jgi:hypothetical protein
MLLQRGKKMLILALITFKAGNLIAFDQLCFEPLHVDEE